VAHRDKPLVLSQLCCHLCSREVKSVKRGVGTEGFHRTPVPAGLYQWRQQFARDFESRHRAGRRSPGRFRDGVRQGL
jgi:hypothetical protein